MGEGNPRGRNQAGVVGQLQPIFLAEGLLMSASGHKRTFPHLTSVRFDPKTAKFQTWPIPGGGNIVRNTSVTPDGKFVLANSLVNAVTLVTIQK